MMGRTDTITKEELVKIMKENEGSPYCNACGNKVVWKNKQGLCWHCIREVKVI